MRSVESVLPYLRAAVRRQQPYHVGTAPHVTVKLNQNESPLDLPEVLKQELMEAFFETPFNRYPREQPEDLLRELADVLDHDPRGLLIGNGFYSFTALLGMLSLVGIVVNNAIVMLEQIDIEREGGLEHYDAIVMACLARLPK